MKYKFRYGLAWCGMELGMKKWWWAADQGQHARG